MIVYKPLPKEIFEHYEIYFFGIEKASDVRNLISRMWEENQQLKLDFELYKDNHSYVNYEVEQLKSVLNEVREKIKLERKVSLPIGQVYTIHVLDQLQNILDKVGDSNE